MIDRGEARWVFGHKEELHSWLLITKNNETYVFDTWNPYGKLYSNTGGYTEYFTVYEY
jgi:hypothetical protein